MTVWLILIPLGRGGLWRFLTKWVRNRTRSASTLAGLNLTQTEQFPATAFYQGSGVIG
jgi:hypothetical protein